MQIRDGIGRQHLGRQRPNRDFLSRDISLVNYTAGRGIRRHDTSLAGGARLALRADVGTSNRHHSYDARCLPIKEVQDNNEASNSRGTHAANTEMVRRSQNQVRIERASRNVFETSQEQNISGQNSKGSPPFFARRPEEGISREKRIQNGEVRLRSARLNSKIGIEDKSTDVLLRGESEAAMLGRQSAHKKRIMEIALAATTSIPSSAMRKDRQHQRSMGQHIDQKQISRGNVSHLANKTSLQLKTNPRDRRFMAGLVQNLEKLDHIEKRKGYKLYTGGISTRRVDENTLASIAKKTWRGRKEASLDQGSVSRIDNSTTERERSIWKQRLLQKQSDSRNDSLSRNVGEKKFNTVELIVSSSWHARYAG